MENTFTSRQTLINENPFQAYHALVNSPELYEIYSSNLSATRRINFAKDNPVTTLDEMKYSQAVLTQMNFGDCFTK